MIRKSLYGFILIGIALIACDRSDDEPLPEEIYQVEVPSNFSEMPIPEDNPFYKSKINLGRMLFYDPILSANNQVSCATCHKQSIAFTDALALSDKGVSGNKLLRHSPALMNLAWMPGLFWEGGSINLESLSLAPIGHPDEMGQNMQELLNELNNHDTYPELFKEAFGVEQIRPREILHSLAQFQRVLISGNSRYDQLIRGDDVNALNYLELEGLSVYRQKCSSCHTEGLFTDNSYHNNGIDSAWNDLSGDYIFTGRFRITFDSSDLGKFKTPSLRNVTLTAPYMHDGRFKDLNAVLDHYENGVKESTTLDSLFQNGEKIGIEFEEGERAALLAFFESLVDDDFLNNPDFSNPFENE